MIDKPETFFTVAKPQWRHVAQGLIVGLPLSIGTYMIGQKVLETQMLEVQARLARQAEFFQKENTAIRAEMIERDVHMMEAIRREEDKLDLDMRELRQEGHHK